MTKVVKSSGKSLSGKVDGYSIEFGERVSTVISRIGTQGRAGEIAGVTDEQLGKWRDGISKPNLFGMMKLAQAADVSLDWLVYGVSKADRQPDFVARMPDGGMLAIEIKGTNERDFVENFALVPRLDVQASAGNGRVAVHEEPLEYLAFQADWLRRRGVNPQAARILTARGDSMEETIRDGDVLLVDTSIDRIRDNAIYVVSYGDMVLVKRIHGRVNGSLQLISDNTRYPAEEVPAEQVNELNIAGRVMWFGRSI